jgi:hypothetical protein
MMCQEVMELMQRYIDGDLDEQETSLMMDHVGRCPDCAAMLDRLKRLSSELEQLPRVMPRYSLVDAILPELERLNKEEISAVPLRIDEDAAAPARSTRSLRPSRDLFRRLSAVVALGVVVGLLLLTQPDKWPFSTGSSSNNEAGPGLDEQNNEANSSSAADSFTLKTPEQTPAVKKQQGSQNEPQVVPDPPKAGSFDTRTFDVTITEKGPTPSAGPSKEPTTETPASPDMSISGGQHVDKSAPATGNEPSSSGQPGAGAVEEVPQPGILADPGSDGKMGFGSDAPNPTVAFVSPDGKWRAVTTEGTATIQIYKTEDDSLLFDSGARDGSIGNLTWSPESTYLYYSWTDAAGNQTEWMFDIANVQESIR